MKIELGPFGPFGQKGPYGPVSLRLNPTALAVGACVGAWLAVTWPSVQAEADDAATHVPSKLPTVPAGTIAVTNGSGAVMSTGLAHSLSALAAAAQIVPDTVLDAEYDARPVPRAEASYDSAPSAGALTISLP